MIKGGRVVWLAAVAGAMLAAPAQAQVRDAEYRGRVREGLPFAQDPGRAAITIKLAGGEGTYERPVHMPVRNKIIGQETGKVKVDGDKIAITGGWKGEKSSTRRATAEPSSAAVPNSPPAKLDPRGQKLYANCSGATKRPLAAFLPKQRKPAE